jgi:hypothetical protein
MPPVYDITSGEVTGGTINPGEAFVWSNPTDSPVTLTNCGNVCTADSYTVPAASGGVPGQTNAMLRTVPNFTGGAFTDPAWDAPGMPHITDPTFAKAHDKKDAA